MAVIGKIQKNSYLLLIVIGLAMLAFIFTDSFKNFGGGEEPLPSGTIFGEEMNEKELSDLQQSYVDREKQNASYQGTDFDAEAEDNARDQAFNELVRKKLMGQELEALGLMVSSAELNDMVLGNNIHPWVSQIGMFKNNIGEYARDSVVKYLDGLQSGPDPSVDTALYSRWKNAKIQWSEFEKELKDARATDKFIALIKKGVYVNSLEAKDSYVGNNESRDITYVMHPYGSITEEEVGFTDADIKAYYQKHKNDKLYLQQSQSADIEFVQFPVSYSALDLERANEEMESLKVGFAQTDNNIYFMATKGEDKFYSDTTGFELGGDQFIMDVAANKYEYPASIDELVQNSKKGDVIGPFKTLDPQTNATQLVIAKVNGFTSQDRAWVRHILISTNSRTDAEAKSLGDSLIRVINAKNNFAEMVDKFTDDPGSKANGGEYKWFKKGAMVAEFEKAAFEGQKGKLQLVKTTYGYHIVEVLGQEARKLPKLAPIRKTVKPGVETIKEVENLAYDFINEVETAKDDSAFYRVSKEKNLVNNYAKVVLSSRFVTGFKDYRKIQKFAFAQDAEEGDISGPILDNSIIKVAYITSKVDEGVPSYEAVKLQMKVPALREKQAAHYIDIMSGIKNINEVANTIPSGQVKTANVKLGTGNIPGVGGNEYKVVGTVFSIDKENEGAMLTPLKGEAGVFLIVLDKVNEVAEQEDYTAEKESILTKRAATADANVMRALRDKANIVDNRQKKAAQGR
ncbi:hypothetical protein DNU06_16170 [Putridiphycobacter roseus]|uniref:Periplasmic chaperone PpiD n=1 Tax=Putridiphycobacter roseus TaxID=2219161 RepID=A0A2W1MVG3_9FLAO|nr:peptidylprolyl isomerase [Putridiphycobacter roseus]PZE15807.1 hypothetical protein DNU06_16170 [Putridiphycobacter roseus]